MSAMLPIEIVLVPFAVITLALTLYFSVLMKLKPSSEIKLSTYIGKTVEQRPYSKNRRQTTTAKVSRRPTAELSTRKEAEEMECPHYVGYLTTLEKGSPFPDECFGCRKVIQCLRIQPTKIIESFYLATPEAKTETE